MWNNDLYNHSGTGWAIHQATQLTVQRLPENKMNLSTQCDKLHSNIFPSFSSIFSRGPNRNQNFTFLKTMNTCSPCLYLWESLTCLSHLKKRKPKLFRVLLLTHSHRERNLVYIHIMWGRYGYIYYCTSEIESVGRRERNLHEMGMIEVAISGDVVQNRDRDRYRDRRLVVDPAEIIFSWNLGFLRANDLHFLPFLWDQVLSACSWIHGHGLS